ncbi:MAG: hypothetical protein N2260_08335 [Syntrophobacterales bacterium]|nr:hypothetical protein [Syntrophobacterales bacterium]
MKRLEHVLPWLVLWLPFMTLTACLALGILEVFKSKPPAPPIIVGQIPQVFFPHLETVQSNKEIEIQREKSIANPFLMRKEQPISIVPQESPIVSKEKVRVSSVFIVNGHKLCLINGMPYKEGNNLLQKATIIHIDTHKVKIRIGDEERVLLVGKDSEI